MERVRVPAGVVEYDEVGSGPPVVLLHGLLMDHRTWDQVLPLLPDGFRYLRPVLPLGAHRVAMDAGADLGLHGMVGLVADLLEALDLHDVTLVHVDWGGALFLTALGRDERVARQVVLPCEAWDNFPPGLPGRMASLAVRLPGGLRLAARQMRVPWLLRTPLLFGQMAKKPLDRALVRHWTEPVLTDAGVRRDLKAYGTSAFDADELCRMTDALAGFAGPVLVVWAPENRVMPPEHGRRLAALVPDGRLVEVADGYVLLPLDQPQAVATAIGGFLRETGVPNGPSSSEEPLV